MSISLKSSKHLMINNNQVCLTGASGFIGSQLSPFLNKNSIPCFHWDRSNPLNFNQSSILVHLAGRAHRMKDSSEDPSTAFRKVNRDLTISLATQAIKQKLKKFVFISSVKVIGENPGNYDLKSACFPKEPYGISKWEAEQELENLFSNQTDTQCIILRLPMVYGEKNKGNMLPLLKAASKKICLPLSAAKGKRSMIYVGNILSAILNIAQDKKHNRKSFQTYFLNDGSDLTSAELYSLIYQSMHEKSGLFYFPERLFRLSGNIGSGLEHVLKRKLPISKNVVSRLFDEYRFKSKKFNNDYNWQPPFTPNQGIKNTVNWYLDSRG